MEILVLFITGILGSTLTYFLSTEKKQGPVRSSSLLSLIVASFFHFFPHLLSDYLTSNIPVVFIGASFIGMVSSTQLSSYIGLSLAGALFTIIYLNTSRFFDGFGGSLGTSACIAVLVILSIPFLRSRRNRTVGFLQLRRLIFRSKRQA